MVVADVVGCGTRASAAKRELRPALRELTMRSEHPAVLLKALDEVAMDTEAGMATMLYGTLDSEHGRLDLFNLGHPPPLIVDPSGVASYVGCDHLPPLGSGLLGGITSSVCDLEPNTTLILYTDGLVERRGEHLSAGLARVRERATGAHRRPPAEICDLLFDAQMRNGNQEDDTTVIVLRLGEEHP